MKAILLCIVALAIPTAAEAASKAKRAHPARGHAAYAAQPQIACTQFGCIPVRRGCYPAQGRTFSGLPSDFDVIVCPHGTMYGIR